MIKLSLQQWRGQLGAFLPTYWQKWDAELKGRFCKHDVDNLSFGYLTALRNYIDQGAQRRPEGLSLLALFELHQLEAKVRHEMGTDYSRLSDTVGLLSVVEMHDFHFLVRDHQNEKFLRDFHKPEDGSLYVQLDFKQHDTLPLGPCGPYLVACWVVVVCKRWSPVVFVLSVFCIQLRTEAGSWWYATARLQVTVLGIICWSKGGGRTYYTYASHCLDQSTPFALSCVADMLNREKAEGYSRQVVWADCGPHFRSSHFLAQVLVLAVQERPQLLTSELHFFAEGHGKGPCDAHFGRMARRTRYV